MVGWLATYTCLGDCHIYTLTVSFRHMLQYLLTYKGGTQRTAGSSLCAMIKKFYHGIQKAVHQFRFKNFEHLLLGSGGNHNLRPVCRRPLARIFHTPVGTLRLDAPALFWVRSPNDGNKLGSSSLSPLSTLPVLRVLFWCNLFDVSSVFWLFF